MATESTGIQFINDDGHRILSYVHAVAEVGYVLHASELEAYGRGYKRLYHTTGGILSTALAGFSTLQGRRTPKESVVEWLARLHWIRIRDGNEIALTELGRAVLRAANLRTTELSDEVAEVILDPDDPYHYAALAGKIANAHKALLVDPYFRLEQMRFVSQFDSIDRVLTSERLTPPQVTELRFALGALHAQGQELEIRQISALHDRFIIDEGGSVLALGCSLNGVGKNISVVVPLGHATADAVRVTHEKIWNEAVPIEPRSLDPAAGNPDDEPDVKLGDDEEQS